VDYLKIVEEIHFTHIRRRMIRIKPSILEIGFGDSKEGLWDYVWSGWWTDY
jgi:hypothetical protein